MTRLTASDLSSSRWSMDEVNEVLAASTGCGLAEIAAGAVGAESAALFRQSRRVSVVPVTAGQGTILGFVEAVVSIARFLGLEADVTHGRDVSGLLEAFDRRSEFVYLADDDSFVALDVNRGAYAENSRATGMGFAQSLHCACGGVGGKPVLVIGLGPAGLGAAVLLSELGASVLAAEPSSERVENALRIVPDLLPVSLTDGLAVCDLVVDACPAPNLIPDRWVRPGCYVAAPGLPLGIGRSGAALLGRRLIHEPLAIGVAVMAAILMKCPVRTAECAGRRSAPRVNGPVAPCLGRP